MNIKWGPSSTWKQSIVQIIWASHIGGYEEFYLLRHNAVQSLESRPTFRRNMSSSSDSFLFFLRNVCSLPMNYMALYSRRQNPSNQVQACKLDRFCGVYLRKRGRPMLQCGVIINGICCWFPLSVVHNNFCLYSNALQYLCSSSALSTMLVVAHSYLHSWTSV
jgi:hypothetical protein